MELETATYQRQESAPIASQGGFCGICLLLAILSVVAGSADVISFLGLGLFNAHITGNLVILAAHVAARKPADLALVLSVPVFVVVLCLMRLLVAWLEALQINSLTLLLLLQLLLLVGLFVLCGAANEPLNPNARSTILGQQLGVAAMAVQTALVQLSLRGAPSTTVMTTNITRFVMDAGDVLLGGGSADAVRGRWRSRHTWPVILGFAFGAALGAWCFAAIGLKSLGLPAALALLGLAAGLSMKPQSES